MEIFDGLIPGAPDAAVALGCFDGLHVGHRQVISAACVTGLVPTVLTFDGGVKAAAELVTQEQKMEILRGLGVEQVYILRFKEIRDETPEQFVDEILVQVCHAKKVCCGFNFTFGRGGKGNSEILAKLCRERGIEIEIVPEVLYDGEIVSSTRIRALVAEGRVKEAAEMLGRPFGFDFKVMHGRRLGHRLGSPTLNQHFAPGFVLPKFGVYASVVHVGGKCWYGVTNVGVKPTVGSDCPLAETWMPEYKGADLYDEAVLVDLVEFIRPEQKFADVQELQANILRDSKTVKNIFEKETAGAK